MCESVVRSELVLVTFDQPFNVNEDFGGKWTLDSTASLLGLRSVAVWMVAVVTGICGNVNRIFTNVVGYWERYARNDSEFVQKANERHYNEPVLRGHNDDKVEEGVQRREEGERYQSRLYDARGKVSEKQRMN